MGILGSAKHRDKDDFKHATFKHQANHPGNLVLKGTYIWDQAVLKLTYMHLLFQVL